MVPSKPSSQQRHADSDSGRQLVRRAGNAGAGTDAGVLMVGTLDGDLHAVDRRTGRRLWTVSSPWGPLVRIVDARPAAALLLPGGDRKQKEPLKANRPAEQHPHNQPDSHHSHAHAAGPMPGANVDGLGDGVFVLEPAGGGDLYFRHANGELQKLDMPLKRIVEESSPFVFGPYAITGNKVSHLVAIDPVTGQVYRTYGSGGSTSDDSSESGSTTPVPDSAVLVGHTQYVLSIFDRQSGRLHWNISYAEFTSSDQQFIDGDLNNIQTSSNPHASSPLRDSIRVAARDNGVFEITTTGDKTYETKFNSPAVAVFEVLPDSPAGRYHQPSGAFGSHGSSSSNRLRLSKIQTPVKPIANENAFLGEMDGTFYLLSQQQFPHLEPSRQPASIDGTPQPPLIEAGSSTDASQGSKPENSRDMSAIDKFLDGISDSLDDDDSQHTKKPQHSAQTNQDASKDSAESQYTSVYDDDDTEYLGDNILSGHASRRNSCSASKGKCMVGWHRVKSQSKLQNAPSGTNVPSTIVSKQPSLSTSLFSLDSAVSSWWLIPVTITLAAIMFGALLLFGYNKSSLHRQRNKKTEKRKKRHGNAQTETMDTTLDDYDESSDQLDTATSQRILDKSILSASPLDENDTLPTPARPNSGDVSADPSKIESADQQKSSANDQPSEPSQQSQQSQPNDPSTNTTVKLIPEKGDNDASEVSVSTRESIVSRPSTTPAMLAIRMTDTVLGYGSHGTVVYKGYFENREVAVKRLLVDFYNVADQETRILQESDHHPNVVRYFYKEMHEGFMYIALELCQATLSDVIERTDIPELHELLLQLKSKHILREIMAGVQHLHSMKIVHRDIKPQNILIGGPKSKKDPTPRILISDFGLGKRLADDQSSFHNTVGFGGGTVGWRAPELLLAVSTSSVGPDASSGEGADQSDVPSDNELAASGWVIPNHRRARLSVAAVPESTVRDAAEMGVRMSRAIDIFSCGCVFYYVLTGGRHPFGDKFSREVNVLRGNHRLDGLDHLKDEAPLAKDLIRRMIAKDPKRRPDASFVLQHPYFWSMSQRLSFLTDLSDRLEVEPREPMSPLLKLIERGAGKVVGSDWSRKVDRSLIEDLGLYRRYDGGSVQDLLRAIRNKRHHYQDLAPSVKKLVGALPDGFWSYFESRFPTLLLHCYNTVSDCKTLRNDATMKGYFE